jgi:isorenieratene synthase
VRTRTSRPATRLARDLRAVHHPAPPGAARPDGAVRAAVVGGGIAGLTAAVALAERGVRVDVFEARPHLGGRVAGWPTTLADGSDVTMSRGFHAFFRQYYNLRNLLRRVDPRLTMLAPLPDYPLQHADGGRDTFTHIPRTPPWNMLAFAALSPTFTLRGLAGMRPRAALPLLDTRLPDVYAHLDHLSAADFLTAIRFPTRAQHLAFEVFSRSFFAHPSELSAAELALMFHIYFLGSAEGLLFDVPDEPYPQALWGPLARHLTHLGARIHTATAVHHIAPRPDGFTLATDTTRTPFDAVVLATHPTALRRLVDDSPRIGAPRWRHAVGRLRATPPFLVSRHWLDRPVAPDRPGFLGTAGYGPLDNVSVLNRWEGEAARWAQRTGGSVVELHAYAVDPGAGRAAVERRLFTELTRLYPETAHATVVDSRHEWHEDCPLFAAGTHHHRPGILTGHPRLVAAGDFVRTGVPVALMERAATTGFQAANALLATWGVRGHPLLTVPTSGRSPLLRTLVRALPPERRRRCLPFMRV